MSEAPVSHSWERVEKWLQANAPTVYALLKPGASETELQNLQTALGVELPSDMLASYRIHNGTLNTVGSVGFAGWDEFLDVDGIQFEWTQAKDWIDADFEGDKIVESQPGTNSETARRVPITRDSMGDYLCVDLAPYKTGTVGQITQIHADEHIVDVVAPDFASLLEQWADDLESGAYSVSELHGLVPAEEWDADKQTWKNLNPTTPLWKRLGSALRIGFPKTRHSRL